MVYSVADFASTASARTCLPHSIVYTDLYINYIFVILISTPIQASRWNREGNRDGREMKPSTPMAMREMIMYYKKNGNVCYLASTLLYLVSLHWNLSLCMNPLSGSLHFTCTGQCVELGYF